MLSNLDDPIPIVEMRSNVSFAMKHLPKIFMLIEQEYVDEVKNKNTELPENLKGKGILSVLIVEDKDQFSSPARLTQALESISKFYSVVAKLEGESDSDLIVLACDSGSDKSFDFLGLAKLTEQVKDIIISIWDRIVFHRQRSADKSLDHFFKSLPIIDKIEELRKKNALSREQSELLKKHIILGATQFMEAGITIPELEEVSYHNPKQLMKPAPKLLVSPISESDYSDSSSTSLNDANDDEDSDEVNGSLSKDEVELLDKLLKKKKGKAKDHNK